MLEAGEAIAQSRLHTGFLVSAARYPDRVALSIGQQQWTYAQIEELARRWAAQLIVVTGGQPARIGVLGYKSLTSYVGILASLFAGATYVPLNPNYPVLRTRVMAQQADLSAIIVDERSISQLPAILDGQFSTPDILSPTSAIDAVPSVASTVYGEREIGSMKPLSEIPEVPASSTAYLLFTSGSTGKPNGVPITHANVCYFLRINSERYQLNQEDTLTQIFDHTFDLAMFDIFMAWSNGAAVSSPEPLELLAPSRYVADRRISVWFSVPSLAALLLNKRFLKPGSLPGLRWSLFCGEALPRKIAEAWQAAAPNSIVENLYGPTELTICCAAYRWNAGQSINECVNNIVPIGQIYSGLDHVIVDDELRLVSPGEVGELCVAGSQTFPGYWRDPARTCPASSTTPIQEGGPGLIIAREISSNAWTGATSPSWVESIIRSKSEAIESILEISRLSSRGNRVSTRRSPSGGRSRAKVRKELSLLWLAAFKIRPRSMMRFGKKYQHI